MKARLMKLIKNKYFIVTFLFLTWLLFFDQNNILNRWQMQRKLKQLQQDKAYYLNEITKDSMAIINLMTNPENLEKFGREKYLMKKDNEDIFVIIPQKQ